MDGFGSDVDRTNGFNRKEDVRAALIHREKNVSSNNPLATYKCTRVSLKLLRCGLVFLLFQGIMLLIQV
jgi:hypothetical protein